MKLLKFSATWCGPCKMLEKLLADYDHPLVGAMQSIDVDNNPDMAMKYGIRSVPTLIILDATDNEVRRTSGMQTVDKLEVFLS